MKRLVLTAIPCLLLIGLTACGAPAAATMSAPLEVPTAAPVTEPPTVESLQPLEAATLTPADTATLPPTVAPTPTETLLPPLELPTLEAFEPALEVWDGVPTYLGDSQPGFYFRVKFDPRLWAQVQDSYGQPALGHREIEYCVLAPSGARGLPPGLQVDHDNRKIGALWFEINTVLLDGQRQFVTYQATDGTIFTSFQVNFVDRADDCLAAAETVLGTLASVPQSQATPVP